MPDHISPGTDTTDGKQINGIELGSINIIEPKRTLNKNKFLLNWIIIIDILCGSLHGTFFLVCSWLRAVNQEDHYELLIVQDSLYGVTVVTGLMLI